MLIDIDENEQNYQQIGANLQNKKKPMAKNYMASTISAASKAVTPRKKILAERNEASENEASEPSSFDTDVREISTFENSHERLSRTEPKSPSVSQSPCLEDDRDADLSSKPYDPLTNYLSPRPQFLRYKPNRRREIFRGGENGAGEEEDGIVSGSGSFDSLKGIDDEAASDTDVGSSISGGGSPPAQEDGEIEEADEEMEEIDEEEIEEEENKGCNVKGVFKTLLLMAVFLLSTVFISSMNSSRPLCEDAYCQMRNQTFETDLAKSLENGNFFSHQRETHKYLIEEKTIVVAEGEVEEIQRSDELKEAAKPESGEVDAVEVAETDDLIELVEPQIEDIEEVSSQLVGNSENQSVEPIEKVEFSEDCRTQLSSEQHDSGSYTSTSSDSQTGIAVSPGEEVQNEEPTAENVKIDFLFKVLVGVLSCSISGLLFYSCLRPKKNSVRKDSCPRENPCSESLLDEQKKISGKDSSLPSQPFRAETRRSVLPTREDVNIDQVYSFGKNPSPAIHSIEKASKEEYSESHAPTVEFLGEFVVKEIRSSAKVNTAKESEKSNYSVSSEKRFSGKSHSVSVQAPQTRSEFSIVDSPSYGSYTTEKETVKRVVSSFLLQHCVQAWQIRIVL